MRIALIDDDATTNFINQNKLKREISECDVVAFSNGKEALDYLAKGNKIEIALLDMNMPVMNGLEFLKKHVLLPKEKQIKKGVMDKKESILLFDFSSGQKGVCFFSNDF
mgnify:CR=1 FL=1